MKTLLDKHLGLNTYGMIGILTFVWTSSVEPCARTNVYFKNRQSVVLIWNTQSSPGKLTTYNRCHNFKKLFPYIGKGVPLFSPCNIGLKNMN